MDLSIIIVNWRTKHYLKRCLDSIRLYPPNAEYEVIVVDNASGDGSVEMVISEFPEVHLIANQDNLKYAEGNNQGVEVSKGDYLLLLNPDIEVKSGALDALLEFARDHPNAGAVGCRLIGPDGKVQRSVRGFPEPSGVLFEYLRLSAMFPQSRLFGKYRMTYFDYSHDAEVDQPMASCLLISKNAWNDVGMFDIEYPIFFNEVDWLYRAKQKGWKVWFTPRAEANHIGGASTGQEKAEMVRESHRSLIKFYEKHYKASMPVLLYMLIVCAIRVNSFAASRLRIGK